VQPHYRREREHQLEPKAARGHGCDRIAAAEGRAVAQLAAQAGFVVPERDAGPFCPVVGWEIIS
jgi:hypothetical protein